MERKNIDYEVPYMTNEQFNTNRNDLIDLMIEKATRLITDPEQRDALIAEYRALKK